MLLTSPSLSALVWRLDQTTATPAPPQLAPPVGVVRAGDVLVVSDPRVGRVLGVSWPDLTTTWSADLKGRTAPVVSPDGRRAAVRTADGLTLFQVADGRVVATIPIATRSDLSRVTWEDDADLLVEEMGPTLVLRRCSTAGCVVLPGWARVVGR